jgi:uncharacterized RDD family membrane protein YckC
VSELVTGEAVALGLHPAKLPSRALAMAIDVVVCWGLCVVLSLGLLVATASLDGAAAAAVSVACWLLIVVGVPIAVETLSHGRSLGKLACGLRVVRDDGGPIRFRHALVRGAVGVVEIQATLGVVACVASLVSARGRRLGDVFGGTLVIRERLPVSWGWAAAPPSPYLAGALSGMDLSAVPEGLWLAVRQYLSRMRQLDPQVSASVAERLASDVAACTGAGVLPGAPPAAFLAAVVAERQAREAQRVFRAPPRAGGDGPGPGPGARVGAPPGMVSAGSGWAVPGAGPQSGEAKPVSRGSSGAAERSGHGLLDGPPGSATGFVPPA